MSRNDDEAKVQTFDGRDYSLWKKRMLLYLKWKKCDQTATRDKLSSEKQEEWEEKNTKAMNFVYFSISNEQLEFLTDETTAFGIMNKFNKMYLKDSTALQICIRNRLDRLKLKDCDNSSTFFGEFEKLINDLKNAGATVTENEKLDYMLKTLPDALSYLGDIIDSEKGR